MSATTINDATVYLPADEIDENTVELIKKMTQCPALHNIHLRTFKMGQNNLIL